MLRSDQSRSLPSCVSSALARSRSVDQVDEVEESELQDRYGHALEQLVTAKLSGGELARPGVPAAPVDLLAALEESVQAARAGRGG
ncbi:hypothetical protein [Streptomyces sp. NPDC093149]|uniref:hypothetical protein n=1 Tax=Streptomyces sp. NPDC093149 TaxID=3366031 RepID=UPI003813E1CB